MTDLLADALAQVLVAVLVALGGWLVTYLPGPLRSHLQASVHQKDVELILGAMARRALSQPRTGTVAAAALDLVAYVRANLPETVSKLAPSDDALHTMARAALQRVAAEVPARGP